MATRTRNRTSRLAVLDSSVRRPASTSSTGRSRSPLLRRAVVIGLVVLSLALITVSFRESSGGPLHGVQNTGAAAMKPFEVAANRVARPFRDAYNWFDGLGTARTRTSSSKAEVERLRQQYATAQTAQNENATLKRLLRYERGASFPKDFRAVNASVIARGAAGRAAARHGVRRARTRACASTTPSSRLTGSSAGSRASRKDSRASRCSPMRRAPSRRPT